MVLVDDLLDVSRITRGKVNLRIEPLELAAVAAEAIESTGPAIEERRHSLVVDVPNGIRVDGDRARLVQVIANLLVNAAKYTDVAGVIHLSASIEERAVLLRVSDTGRGIQPDMLPRIFDLLVQERQSAERQQGGLGIGLAIVRSLIEAHGGTVAADSAGHGRGSTFTVTLPLATAAARQSSTGVEAPAPAEVTTGERILIVDDNMDGARLLADSLASLGHATSVAFDGPSALAIARSFRPTIALLDLGLPVMDGYELGQRLRDDFGANEIILVAITGYAQETDRSRTQAAGFSAHYVKPVDVMHIESLIHQRQAQSTAKLRAQ